MARTSKGSHDSMCRIAVLSLRLRLRGEQRSHGLEASSKLIANPRKRGHDAYNENEPYEPVIGCRFC